MADECTCWAVEDEYCDFCGMMGEYCSFCHPELEEEYYDYDED